MDVDQILTTYVPRLPHFPQQRTALRLSLKRKFFALFMDQGTGKTKVIIDTVAILYRINHYIDGLLIVAPNDVHIQWIEEQLPLHMPKDIPYRAFIWKSKWVKGKRLIAEMIKKPKPNHLHILAMNHEAFATKAGRATAYKFVRKFKTFFALDESDLAIMTPKAERSKAMIRISKETLVRRILTGTPGDTPFKLYNQFRFLDERILGFDSFLAFKHRYAEWETNTITGKQLGKDGKRKLIEYETLVEYKNLDELNARMDPYTYRVRKEDCMDLPPKIFGNRFVHLSDEQRAIYDELKEHGLVMLKEAEECAAHTPEKVLTPVQVQRLADMTEEELLEALKGEGLRRTTAAIKLTLMLRLQQVVGGYITDDQKNVRAINPDMCPRMEATLSLVRNALEGTRKVIVWGVFRPELLELATRIQQDLCPAGLVYGGVTGDKRSDLIRNFKDPKHEMRVLVSHPASLGVGMNFTVAGTAIYYSCGASGRVRLQSEDRIHRAGMQGTVSIYDLDARDVPIDATLRDIRKRKLDYNASVMSWKSTTMENMI